jgi:hypothetical protein
MTVNQFKYHADINQLVIARQSAYRPFHSMHTAIVIRTATFYVGPLSVDNEVIVLDSAQHIA